MKGQFVRAIYIHHDGCKFDLDHYYSIHVALGANQMALGNLGFDKRVIETGIHGFFDQQPQHVLTITYYSQSIEFIEKFRKFMQTDLVDPLIEDAKIYTNCEVQWVSGSFDDDEVITAFKLSA